MTMALGNGAACSAPSKRTRPRRKCMSPYGITSSCHHAVSVLAGRRHTTRSACPCCTSPTALAIQRPISRPYGGFIQHTPCQRCIRPLVVGGINILHLAFSQVAHTSRVKGPCDISQARNNSQGVAQSIFLLEKCTFIRTTPALGLCRGIFPAQSPFAERGPLAV